MDGTAFAKKSNRIKIFYGVSISITAVALCLFINARFMINFANVTPYERSTGIEHLPVYSALAISSAVLLICLILCCVFKSNSKKTVAIKISAIIFAIIVIFASYFISSNIVDTVSYVSRNECSELSKFFPIDKYDYGKSNEDFYSYKEVTFGDVYWIGNYSSKDFESGDSFEDLTEEPNDSSVCMNYYYLKDDTGRLISEYNKKKQVYDTWFSLDNYVNEYKVNEYHVYEYEDCYEFILIDETEVFYFSATKNKRTSYDYKDLLKTAEGLKSNLKEWADISKLN